MIPLVTEISEDWFLSKGGAIWMTSKEGADWMSNGGGKDELVSLLYALVEEIEEENRRNFHEETSDVKPEKQNCSTRVNIEGEVVEELLYSSTVKRILSNAIYLHGKKRGALYTAKILYCFFILLPMLSAAEHVEENSKNLQDWHFTPSVYSERFICIAIGGKETKIPFNITLIPKDNGCQISFSQQANFDDFPVYIDRYSICLDTDYILQVPSLGNSYSQTFRNPPGFPSVPQNAIAEIVNNSVKLSWKEPQEKNGPINGYIVILRNKRDIYIEAKEYEITNGTMEDINNTKVAAYNKFFDSMLLSQPADFTFHKDSEEDKGSSQTDVSKKFLNPGQTKREQRPFHESSRHNTASTKEKNSYWITGLLVISFLINC